jgi:hypothetical protein
MQDKARSSIEIQQDFFNNAGWLVLNVLFLKLHPEQGEALSLSGEEESAVTGMAINLVELLWSICQAKGFVSQRIDPDTGMTSYEQTRAFRSVFSTSGDCQILRSALLAKLAQERTPAATQV